MNAWNSKDRQQGFGALTASSSYAAPAQNPIAPSPPDPVRNPPRGRASAGWPVTAIIVFVLAVGVVLQARRPGAAPAGPSSRSETSKTDSGAEHKIIAHSRGHETVATHARHAERASDDDPPSTVARPRKRVTQKIERHPMNRAERPAVVVSAPRPPARIIAHVAPAKPSHPAASHATAADDADAQAERALNGGN